MLGRENRINFTNLTGKSLSRHQALEVKRHLKTKGYTSEAEQKAQ